MRKRVFNLLSLLTNLFIIFLNVSSIIYNFRSDILHDADEVWPDYVRGWTSLTFFTNLSNILLVVACVILLVYNIKNILHDRYEFPRWAFTVKYVAVCATTLTMLTVVVFLSPLMVYMGKSYFELFKHNSLFLHLISPLFGLFSLIFFERTQNFGFKKTFLGVVPTAIYSVFYVIMVIFIGQENGGLPDYYGLTFGGNNWMIAISGPVMIGMTYLISYLVWLFYSKFTKKVSLEDDTKTENEK